MDVSRVLRNALQLLQKEPRRYKLFGVWWWAIKVRLQQAGYTSANLYLLGSYIDAESAALMPSASLVDMLRAAFAEYACNARLPHPDERVRSPGGELVTIWDQDAGF